MARTGKNYKALDVKKSVSKNGKPFTIIKVCDRKANPNTESGWEKSYYKIFVFSELDIDQNDMIKWNAVENVDASSRVVNGITYNDCTLFVDKKDIVIEKKNGSSDLEETDYKAPWED